MCHHQQKTLLILLISVVLTSAAYGYVSPESVTFDPARNRYLVSDQGTGNIYQIDSTGHSTLFSSALGVAKGLYVSGDTLFASGSTAGLFAFDLETAEILFEVDFPGQVDLNDVAGDTSGNIFVSDAQGNQIFRLHLADMSTMLVVPSVTMANGLLHDAANNRMLYCQWVNNSPISAIDLSDFSVTVVADDGLDLLDGLTRDQAGNIYVSSFGSDAVHRYDKDFSGPPEIATTGHNNPGDIFYNQRDEIMAVPNVSGGNVQFIFLPIGPEAKNVAFSDNAYGNGDGVMEAGEKIELYFDLINTRPDSVFDLEMRLFFDDASLIIENGQVEIGNMAYFDTVNTAFDPFTFEIPAEYLPRIATVSLELDYRFRGDRNLDTLQFERMMGRPRVLIVDDDNGDNLDQYYSESLENFRIPYLMIDADIDAPSDFMADHDLVIWFVGDYRLNPLDSAEKQAIRDYLDMGGRLFLTGQSIATQMYVSGDDDFLNNYLRCDYLSTSFYPVLAALPGSSIFEISDSLYIDGANGADNQVDPDHITSVNGGQAELTFIGTADAGAVSYSGSYRLVFFSFGFEGVASGFSRWTDRDNVMEKVLGFLDYPLPMEPLTISIAPGNPMHLTEHVPDISWEYGAGGYDQHMYNVQAGTDMDWTVAEMWDTGPQTGAITTVNYAGESLIDGQTYYIRVRVSNGVEWSNWYYSTIRMNSAPSAPDGLSPDDMAAVTSSPVILSHNNAVDNENDNLVYEYEVYDDASLSLLVFDTANYPEAPGGVTFVTVSESELVAGDYYWRVRGLDGFEPGVWSDVAAFDLKNYLCGDANGDVQVNVGDAVALINFIFKGGAEPVPPCSGDANGDGNINVGDAVYLITYVFRSGPAPVESCCY